ncbi:MAG TPA: 2-amino-4-hydroxy-6-hydroxymethyldihydropteridine diphosphokinase [Candidatus Dormibacteraeota bacterium]|nr:2-amino-4-hydroxy-6-hydroxymethyldihydropteridine diphosphokinase [Candidatus Dormibacteraeota bacterium]
MPVLPRRSRAVLALGSNLPPRPEWLEVALSVLAESSVEVVARTPRWHTRPIGEVAQPDFLNQLLLAEGLQQGREWLELAQRAEDRAGRSRSVPKGPRRLDVDLILIEDEHWESADLTVPHPGLLLRPYLLRGAAQLVPTWVHPVEGQTIAALARRLLTGSWGEPRSQQGRAD